MSSHSASVLLMGLATTLHSSGWWFSPSIGRRNKSAIWREIPKSSCELFPGFCRDFPSLVSKPESMDWELTLSYASVPLSITVMYVDTDKILPKSGHNVYRGSKIFVCSVLLTCPHCDAVISIVTSKLLFCRLL